MELAFANRQLRRVCEDDGCARGKYPEYVAESLQDRLADIRAADSPLDLLAGSPHLTPGRPARISIHLADDYQVYLEVNHSSPPTNGTGTIDWSRVRRLKVTTIRRAQRGNC